MRKAFGLAARDCVAMALLWCCLPAAAQSVPHSSHVVLVIEENHQFTDVQAQMPWLISMGNQYGYAANYEADSSGSLRDYLWLSSGSCEASSCSPSAVPPGSGNFGCTGSACSSPITDDNIFRILTNAGISWKEYMESYTGWNGADTSLYVKRHNPAAWYSDVINSPTLQSKIVDFGSHFASDANANNLPNYSIVVPNLQNDAHDGTLGQADAWLQQNIAPILNTPPFQAGGDGLLIITFDECDAAAGGGCSSGTEHVYTAVIGPKVIPHVVSNTFYKHENALRTILQAVGATDFPLAASSAAPMSDFFVSSGGGTVPDIDDQTWTCTGNCSTSIGTVNQLDGASVKFQYTGGSPFTEGVWTTPLAGDFSGETNYTLDLRSFIQQPSLSQALEVHLLQQVGGEFYPFKIQCDFKDSGFWRVYNPPTDSWVQTPVRCVVFTANSWDHFIFHFHRSGNQLVYQDIVINNVTYSFNNIATNAIGQSGSDSVKAQVVLIGNSSGSAYAWWIDEMALTFH